MLRADLHVHTCHSRISGTLTFLGSRDCYSTPEEVYRVAKSRGMDLVAITDHDTMDGALELLTTHSDASDIIAGEEVSCRFPDYDLEVHLGVYGMTESLHADLQPLRSNVFDVIARLRQENVFFALNHLLHFYRRQIPFNVYLQLLDLVPALEARNGAMLPAQNELVCDVAAAWQKKRSSPISLIGGSDAHTLRRVGLTWTSAPGSTRDEFFLSLRSGLAQPGGAHGGVGTVTAEAYGVIRRYLGSLVGFGPHDHRSYRRAALLAFAAVSLPFEFMPVVVAARGKARERQNVEDLRRHLTATESGIPEREWLLEPGP
jgi:hypothetical protein